MQITSIGDRDFLLAVLTLPGYIPGEIRLLEDLLEAGVSRLHIRKPDLAPAAFSTLLEQLAPRWASRLVLHGSRELAGRYGIPQLHGSVAFANGQGRSGGGPFVGAVPIGEPSAGKPSAGPSSPGESSVSRPPSDGEIHPGLPSSDVDPRVGLHPPAISTSVHSWEEFKALPGGLAYAFISPLFDSISKPGYNANATLLQPPAGILPCRPIGLGGISAGTIGTMIRQGWTGAAVLGYIWDEPNESLKRYEQLKKSIDDVLSGK
jgi:thiamine-phosphate pyrophosphorylase